MDVRSATKTPGKYINTQQVKPNVEEDSNVIQEMEPVAVKYIIRATFNKCNTHLGISAVEEIPNFEEAHPEMSFNDKVLYYLKLPQKLKYHISSGHLGFRAKAKKGFDPAFQVSSRFFSVVEQRGYLGKNIEIILCGNNYARRGFIAALLGKEGAKVKPWITRISDNTKIKFGGPRAKAYRRV